MSIASGSSHGMAYVAETAYGVTPAAPAFKSIRHTGTTLGLTKESFQSQELRADRQITDFRHGARQVGGDISCELSYGAFDDLLEAALGDTWVSNTLKTGTTRRSFTIERRFGDIGQYLRYTGVEFDGLHLTVQPSGIATITFPVVGQDQAGSPTALNSSTYASAGMSAPFDAFSGEVKEGGAAIAVVTEIQLQLQNTLTAQFAVGGDKTIRPSWGRSNVTGTATLFFENVNLLNKFANETESSLEFTVGNGAATLNFKCPRIKYSGGKPDINNDGPITLAMPFQALFDSVAGANLIITRHNGGA